MDTTGGNLVYGHTRNDSVMLSTDSTLAQALYFEVQARSESGETLNVGIYGVIAEVLNL